jgi:diguanylate cyclase (GGDEF)-like protein
MSIRPQPEALLAQARHELGLSLGRRAEECAQRVDARMGASRWAGKPPSQAYLDARQEVSWFATLMVARWLVSSTRPEEAEMTWASMRGRRAAEEGLSIINVARGYLVWRDSAIEILKEEGEALGVPPTVLAEALETVRSSCDAALMRMSAEFDGHLETVSEERNRLEDQLRHQTLHDPLTGLANRTLFTDRLTHAVERNARTGATVVALVIDVDDFKAVNDSAGHSVGDLLIVEIGHRLRSSVRAGDTVARLGGDEFGVLLESVTDMGSVMEAARRMLAVFDTPCQLADRRFAVTASIGLAMAAADTDDPDELVRNADIAMYVAKARGKARYVLFAAGMELGLRDRMQPKEAQAAPHQHLADVSSMAP